jgi:hypothetical protein
VTSSRRLALSFAFCFAVLPPALAAAQPHVPSAQELETARTLYKEGKELRARGDLRGALEKLQAAHALGNTPVTGIELARTEVMLGQLVEAREVCLYIARIPVALDETEKSAEARTEAASLAEELRPKIGTLLARVEGLAAGEPAHLSIDGAAVPDAAFGEAQKVNPGKHVVVVRAGEGPAAREVRGEAVVAEGQAAEVAITVPPPPAMTPPPPPPPQPEPPAPSPGAGPTIVRIGFATAIAGGAVGLIAGLTTMNKKGQLPPECPKVGTVNDCPENTGAAQDLNTARTWGNVSTAAFVIGGAGVVVGVVGLLTSKPARPKDAAFVSPWLGLGAAGVYGRF